MAKKNGRFSFTALLIDLGLLVLSFVLWGPLQADVLELPPPYLRLSVIVFFAWTAVSLATRKFYHGAYKRYGRGIFDIGKSIVYMAYVISFLAVLAGAQHYSKIQIAGTILLFLLLEIAVFTVYFFKMNPQRAEPGRIEPLAEKTSAKSKTLVLLILGDFLLLSAAFFLMNLFKRGNFELSAEYVKILLLLYGLWFLVSQITRKFKESNLVNFHYAMAACMKSVFLMAAALSVIIFIFDLFYYSRLHVFGSLLIFLALEAVFYYLSIVLRSSRKEEQDIESLEEISRFQRQKVLSAAAPAKPDDQPTFMKILLENYLATDPFVSQFIKNSVDISAIEGTKIALMDGYNRSSVQIHPDNSLMLIINFHRLNDVRWINRYLLEMQEKLISGGYLVGWAEPIEAHKKKFFKKFPRYYAEVMYALDFLFHRVLPKMPQVRNFYFTLTKGKGRVLSRAEVLGRLHFCGFQVLSEGESDGHLLFLAQKTKTPSLDENPSYGLIIKLKRMGLNGEMINIYKLRTMYPFSEYLQDYVYKLLKLKEGGKIKDDFRITEWGKVMRKYWLDEIPMLYNWIKGEIKLVGIRPLSLHYFELYNPGLQEMRKKMKPGLIPPYYADLPKDLDEIAESERKYIEAYNRHPLKTQVIYLGKVLNNVLIKGARSA